jgi:homocysteine S-methyltransferase
MKDFRTAVTDDRVYVFDGAMGTMLYSRGVYINRCYDELNLTSADLVLGIQREYVKAGADARSTPRPCASPARPRATARLWPGPSGRSASA